MRGLFGQPFEVRKQHFSDDIFVMHTKEMCKRDLLRNWGSRILFYSGIALPILSVQYRTNGVWWHFHFRFWHPLFWIMAIVLFFSTFFMGGIPGVVEYCKEFPTLKFPRKERKYHYFNAANGIKVVVTQKR